MLNVHGRPDGTMSGGETDTDASDNEVSVELRRDARRNKKTLTMEVNIILVH